MILGTEYAGEMKKGVFTIMNYLMPKRGVLSMHCSANDRPRDGTSSLFFGLSGTGKTTLSADPKRQLIGDDEHCWSDDGVFNIEGGCYAKCIDLTAESEPEIFQACASARCWKTSCSTTRPRDVDFTTTQHHREHARRLPDRIHPQRQDSLRRPAIPTDIIFLTCDAFGVLPPVSKLTPAQAMYHFISGYTAKVAGTEMGVTEPQATFSALLWRPVSGLAPDEVRRAAGSQDEAAPGDGWLVNTGWSGGAYGTGSRIRLEYTRAIIDAIHSKALDAVPAASEPVFRLTVPKHCPGVPDQILLPEQTWPDRDSYLQAASQLAGLFRENFSKFGDNIGAQVGSAGPKL